MCWQSGSLHQNPASLSDRRLTERWGEEQQSGKWEARSKKKKKRRGGGVKEGKLDGRIWEGWIKTGVEGGWGTQTCGCDCAANVLTEQGRRLEPWKDERMHRGGETRRWLIYKNSEKKLGCFSGSCRCVCPCLCCVCQYEQKLVGEWQGVIRNVTYWLAACQSSVRGTGGGDRGEVAAAAEVGQQQRKWLPSSSVYLFYLHSL